MVVVLATGHRAGRYGYPKEWRNSRGQSGKGEPRGRCAAQLLSPARFIYVDSTFFLCTGEY
ncbi:unnamed protein product [Ceutorhynchus assimilis]|uniref:Uncharacterized protein n=1 Tax=Ceutorhynchus assimilis TaxID=467358 RepID=A0A9N9MZF0_9CUCU|nr:unnamed protein product [Ceutorhynchus assimilis]